jgi:alanine or glycine:cation symporter, AGCS family
MQFLSLAWLLDLNDRLNDLVWGPPFMALLVGAGLYLTIRLRGFQFTHLGFAWRHSFGQVLRRKETDETGAIPSFQAVAAAMAATIGVGNVAGVATALALGGPGAIFWMWMVALVGMATKFAEASLGLKYRHVAEDGTVSGGAFYYIERGLGWKPLALLYALLAGLASFGIGNMVQANTMAHALETGFAVPSWVTGAVALVLVGAVTLGGIARIGKAAGSIVPFMAVTYFLAALLVLVLNIAEVPAALGSIVYHAFQPAAAAGGFAGAGIMAAMRFGIARGIFSNEAGLGSASIVHAQARNTPGGQGLWGIWEVAIDTLIIGTMTALVILVTGVLPTGSDRGGTCLLRLRHCPAGLWRAGRARGAGAVFLHHHADLVLLRREEFRVSGRPARGPALSRRLPARHSGRRGRRAAGDLATRRYAQRVDGRAEPDRALRARPRRGPGADEPAEGKGRFDRPQPRLDLPQCLPCALAPQSRGISDEEEPDGMRHVSRDIFRTAHPQGCGRAFARAQSSRLRSRTGAVSTGPRREAARRPARRQGHQHRP